MLQFKKLGTRDWQVVQQIAYQTWPVTYEPYLTPQQINWVLATVYSEQSLHQQMLGQQHLFLLAIENGQALGFVSYENNYEGLHQLMIHKLYLLPASQGSGIGTQIIGWLEAIAKAGKLNRLLLKVFCRNGNAIGFYEKLGFIKIGTAEKNIGNNCTVLDDIMAKDL